jgi:hypothetical protein
MISENLIKIDRSTFYTCKTISFDMVFFIHYSWYNSYKYKI